MGEYAKTQNGEEVKIGTCESMYYLRFDDKHLVTKLPGSIDAAKETNLFWRLPFPDEDAIGIGNYSEYNRGLRLSNEFSDPDTVSDPGTMQLRNDSGLLVNVKCYHGEKLPESTGDFKVFWNGKSWFYELAFIKNIATGIVPVVRCRHCGQMWRYSWDDILPFVIDAEMHKRLERYSLVK